MPKLYGDKYMDEPWWIIEPKGHVWCLNEDGYIDHFAYEIDPHNGPRCARCGLTFCCHCERKPGIEPCPQQEENG
jgi:hypothetical protein